MIRSLMNYFSGIFTPPLERLIEEAAATEAQSVLDCNHVIRMHEFQRHMSQSMILALAAWTSIEKEREKETKINIKEFP